MKKKVGILTFHRTSNYGAVLQCYAFFKTIEKFCLDVLVIDYIQPYIEKNNKPFSFKYLLDNIFYPRKLYSYIKGYVIRKRIYNRFEDFRQKYLLRTQQCNKNNIPQNFDYYVIGSDQLWSTTCTETPDEVFWGNFNRKQSSRVYTYAISGNVESLKKLSPIILKQYLQNFDLLSVREDNLKCLIEKHTEKECFVSIDPTLLNDSTIWDEITVLEKECVLVYEARFLKNHRDTLKTKALQIASSLGCEVINLSNYNYSPEEFVSYFKYAKYIVTSSFHGVAFSLIFKKPFTAVKLNDGHDDRYVNLLTKIGAANIIKEIDFTPEVLTPDYDVINENLQMLQSASINYLKKVFK